MRTKSWSQNDNVKRNAIWWRQFETESAFVNNKKLFVLCRLFREMISPRRCQTTASDCVKCETETCDESDLVLFRCKMSSSKRPFSLCFFFRSRHTHTEPEKWNKLQSISIQCPITFNGIFRRRDTLVHGRLKYWHEKKRNKKKQK